MTRLASGKERNPAASTAISAGPNGPLGTITHQHAVGVDHAPYLGAEIGERGIDVLAATKATLDPPRIRNPGNLIR